MVSSILAALPRDISLTPLTLGSVEIKILIRLTHLPRLHELKMEATKLV